MSILVTFLLFQSFKRYVMHMSQDVGLRLWTDLVMNEYLEQYSC